MVARAPGANHDTVTLQYVVNADDPERVNVMVISASPGELPPVTCPLAFTVAVELLSDS